MKLGVEQVPQTRRELLCGAARCAALGGMALLSATLIARGQRTADESECPLEGAAVQLPPQRAQDGTAVVLPPQQRAVCGNCAAFSRCGLPAAAAARRQSEG